MVNCRPSASRTETLLPSFAMISALIRSPIRGPEEGAGRGCGLGIADIFSGGSGLGNRGRFPKPRRCPPPDLCYAVVVKQREQGRITNVTTRIVYGTQEQIQQALQDAPTSTTINTAGVERNNLTVRQHSRRLGRKVNAFSKDRHYLEHQLMLAFAYYHFVIPHRGLRQRLPKPIPTKGPQATYKKRVMIMARSFLRMRSWPAPPAR